MMYHKKKVISKEQHEECNQRYFDIETTMPPQCKGNANLNDPKAGGEVSMCDSIREIG